MYLMAQSCLHLVINFPRPPKPHQNMLYLTLFHRPLQNSAKFRGNVKIPQKQAIPQLSSKFRILQKTVALTITTTTMTTTA